VKAGLDFNTGEPVALHDGQTESAHYGYSTICDSSGKLLFYIDYSFVFNKIHQIMQGGTALVTPSAGGRAIVKWPGQEGMYYIFSPGYAGHDAFSYSIVDLKLDGGKGAITSKNVPVEAALDASGRVATVRQTNSDNVWVITRKFTHDAMVAFLVDEDGFDSIPVSCDMPDQAGNDFGNWGYIKVSYDKKYIVSTYQGGWGGDFEFCHFNATNGTSEYMYSLNTMNGHGAPRGIEFSPDSKFMYVVFGGWDSAEVYQFDMSLIENPGLFSISGILVGTGVAWNLQLARDGMIYFGNEIGYPYYNMNVISKPWISGPGCTFEMCNVSTSPGEVTWGFNNILVDYLLRFEWTGETCQGYPIQFKPNFIPIPQTIQWDFDDGPGSTSWQLSPSYRFKNPGVHEIKVDVWYPSGRYEHTSREIEISPSPLPLLGNDTLICNGASITLNANCDADFFTWSTGQFGASSITVSDSGMYWVRARYNSSGCLGYDTIHIGFHPPTIIDETKLIITPTTCNGASGSITGLAALGPTPFAYRWKDLSEVEYGTDIDVSGLPAGQYYLTITDSNSCETVSDVYTIEDAGNLEVLEVELALPHCGRSDGEIIVHAFSPAGTALQYSIDGGTTYQADSVFSDLIGTGYVVRVTDGAGCFGFYVDNPVVLEDIPGPLVTQVNVTDETDFLGNGAIEIVASGSTSVIYYSIDSGATYQSNNGTFSNVLCGMYYVIIKDENGCDTAFTVEVQNIILTYLHAVTGEDGLCDNSITLIPVNVDNFNNVADFHLKLSYNADNLQCEGFTNVQPQLFDSLTGWVDQAAGIIYLAWTSPLPITFTQPETVAELVFTTKNPGQGELAWYTGTTESYFTNAGGNPIPAEFQTGEVKIYEPPEIILDQTKTVCTGQFVYITASANGNQQPLTFRWIYPTGDTTDNDPLFFSVTQSDAGLYTLLATDRVGCTDQKSIELIVSDNPVAAFHGIDTLEMHAGDALDAGPGMASYRWSPEDTMQTIVIQAEGMYLVEMESLLGCIGSDSVYVKLLYEEVPEFQLYIPNAFSPNGDGTNDTFKISTNSLNIQHSTLSIYDRWGGLIVETDGIVFGWDGTKNGKDCPGGVYVYKIVFEVDGVAGNQEKVGTVMLVR
jgi:gliding motility-associated-like protein